MARGLHIQPTALCTAPCLAGQVCLPGWSRYIPAQGSPTLPERKDTGLGYREAIELSRAVLPGQPGSEPSGGEPSGLLSWQKTEQGGEVARELRLLSAIPLSNGHSLERGEKGESGKRSHGHNNAVFCELAPSRR